METESIVLLENRKATLPLSKSLGSVALIGPQVDRVSASEILAIHLPLLTLIT